MKTELFQLKNSDVKKEEIKDKSRTHKKQVIIYVSCILIVIIGVSIFLLERKFGIINAFINRNKFQIQTENSSKYIGIGEEMNLTVATALFQDEVEEVNWFTTDEKVISVNDGIIKGLSLGKVVIYGTSEDRTSNHLELECLVKVDKIDIDKEKIVLPIKEKAEIKASITPENATYKELKWTSTNEDIATVKNGKVYGKNIGECKIIVSDITGEVIKECDVEVVYVTAENITLDDTEVQIAKGNKYILSETIYPDNVTDKRIEWSSTDENIISVENGIVKANSVGKADVIATTIDGKFAACSFEVYDEESEHEIRYARGNYDIKMKPKDMSENIMTLKRNDVLYILNNYGDWSKVSTLDGKVGYISNNGVTVEKSYFIENVPFLDQYKLGYPTGCEAVSATMVANYYGYDVTAEEVINNTPTDERGIWTEQEIKEVESSDEENEELVGENEEIIEEVIYASNPFEVFVGHPSKNYEQGSYGCYAKPIIKSLETLGINCIDISGCTQDELLQYIREGKPLVVWGTYNGRDIIFEEEWIYPDKSGSYEKLTGEHCMVLIGYDDENVYLNDPIAGENVTQTKEQFFKNWDILYRQAITIY